MRPVTLEVVMHVSGTDFPSLASIALAFATGIAI
jgi:hypothetical protein